jgi:redox-sensitive bicupin YhaK (pirin superfamily)
MGFRSLRVMNEDRVGAGSGFGMHGHRDMEIITYVLEGSLEHRDSMGNGSVLRAGDLQHMTAGTGVRHSEFNPSASEPLHLYQIWLLPDRTGLAPVYSELRLAEQPASGGLRLVASRDGRNGSLLVQQDVDISLASLKGGESITHELRAGRHAWLQVIRGDVEIDGQRLVAGDGAAISNATQLSVTGLSDSEVMLFDLA